MGCWQCLLMLRQLRPIPCIRLHWTEVTESPSSHPDCSPEKGETLSGSPDQQSSSQGTAAPVAAGTAAAAAAAFASASGPGPVQVSRASYPSA
jgi:hypothetical protein